MRTHKQLCEKLKIKPNLEKAKIHGHMYGSEKDENNNFKVLGKTTLSIETTKKISYETFYVIDTKHKNLLSGNAAISLEILLFNKPLYNLQESENIC